MGRDVKEIKQDRLRYTKNKLSANLTYIAILFDVLYFVSIYSSNVSNYYYTIMIGASVLCNLLFLLIAFLSSEGVKSYKINYAYILVVIGCVQLLRIFGIPRMAHAATAIVAGVETIVMDNAQFAYVCGCLILSAVAAIAAGAIGIYKSTVLKNYEKKHGLA